LFIIHVGTMQKLDDNHFVQAEADTLESLLRAEQYTAMQQLDQHMHQVSQDQQASYMQSAQALPFGGQNVDFSLAGQSSHNMQYRGHQQLLEEDHRKPRSSTGATNDTELKEILRNNVGRSLDDVSREVVANERGSAAEKTKQLFAMLW
jgi:hypothetical protein